MALNVGELYAELTMDSAPFDKAVGGLKGKLGAVGGMAATALGGAAVAGMAALGGAIIGGIASVDNYRKALNGLGASTGATSKEMSEMGQSMKELYVNGMGESFEDIAQSMGEVRKTTGMVGEELKSATNNALLMRDTFGFEVNESITAVDKMMKQFGVTSDEAYTLIAQGAQQGLDKNGDMIDTLNEYSVYFKTLGFDAEGMFDVLKAGSDAGVINLDKVADAVKEFGIRVKDGSKTTVDAFSGIGMDADEMAAKFAKGGDSAQSAFTETMAALAKIEDPVKRNTIGVGLFGTQFEDLEAKAILAMGNVKSTMDQSADTLNKINSIKYNSFGEAMAGIGRQIEVGLIMPIGEKLLPHLNNFANWLAGKMPAIIEYFNQLGTKASGMVDLMAPAFQRIQETLAIFGEKLTLLGAKFAPLFDNMGAKIGTFVELWTMYFGMLMSIVGPILDLVLQKVMEVVSMIVSWWQSNGQALLQNVMIVFKGIYSVIQFIMPAVLAIISMVFNNIKGVIQGALNIIGGIFAIFAGLFTGNWSKMWDGVKQLLSGALQFIWNLWQLMLYGKLIAGIKMLATKGLGLFKGMWGSIKAGWSSFTTGVVNIVSKMVSGVVKFFVNLVQKGVQNFNTLRTFGASIFGAIRSVLVNIVSNIVSTVVARFNLLKTGASNAFTAIKNAAGRVFSAIKTAMTKPIETAKSTILRIIDAIKGAFSRMKITIPKIKLPKVSVGTKKNALFGIDVPTFNVDWFKTGGIATGAAIAGVGEAGSEAIVPLSGRRMKPFSDAVGAQVAAALGGINTGGAQDINLSISIDGRQFAKATKPYLDAVDQRNERQSARAEGYNI